MSEKEWLRLWSVAAVDDWAQKHGGEDAVRNLLARKGQFFVWHDKISEKTARAWLEAQASKRVQETDAANLSLAERSAVAAERSAQAAESAAVSARESITWSRWAAIIAVAALFFAAWPYIAERVR
jgi:hypothetical protein